MKTFVDLSGLERLTERIRTIENLDPRPLLDHFKILIEADNRKGVLAGLDKDGEPMAPVTYRPVGKPSRLTARQKNYAKGRRGKFAGFGSKANQPNNNLTTAEYRKLAGPPLAPRGAFSRVITNLNLAMEHERDDVGRWCVVVGWLDVVSVKGRKFLHAHFEGLNGLKQRDLRGVRPDGMAKARKAAIAWMRDQVQWVIKGGGKAA